MTDKPLDAQALELIGLAEKATGGEWFAGAWNGQCHQKHDHSKSRCVYDYSRTPPDEYFSRFVSTTLNHAEVVGSDDYGPSLDRETAAFIAHARNHAPTIAHAYLEARAEIERLERANAIMKHGLEFIAVSGIQHVYAQELLDEVAALHPQPDTTREVK